MSGLRWIISPLEMWESNFSNLLANPSDRMNGNPIWQVWLGVVLVSGLSFVSWRLYSLYHGHTERSRSSRLPPGPPKWPIVGNLFELAGSHPHRILAKMHEKYGPLFIFHLGEQPTVVTNDPKYLKEFWVNQDHVFASRPATIAIEHFTYSGMDFAMAPLGNHWRKMRKLVVYELLAAARIDTFREERREELDLLLAAISKSSKSGELIDMRDVLGACSMSTTSRMLVGRRQVGFDEEETYLFQTSIERGFHHLGLVNIGDVVPWLRWLDLQGYERDMKEIMRHVDRVLEKNIKARREALHKITLNVSEKEAAPTCFLDSLITYRHAGEEGDAAHLSNAIIKAVILDVLAAGTDTTTLTSEWTLLELTRHPEIQEKAQAEIDFFVGCERRVEETALSELSYLKAIIKEIFRIHPPGVFNVPHESIQDAVVHGYFIPKGTRVLVNAFALGINKEIFQDPDVFNPDRWLTDEEKQCLTAIWSSQASDPSRSGGSKCHETHKDDMKRGGQIRLWDADFKIVPFGAGRRGCPGSYLGQNLVMLVVATLLHAYRWCPPHGVKPQDLSNMEQFGQTSPPATRFHAIALQRKNIHAYSS